MRADADVRRACAVVRELPMLPLERVEHPLVTVVRDASKPDVWDANHACAVRASRESEIDEVLGFVDRALPANVRHRDFRCDPETPPAFVARLLHEGFDPGDSLQMRLSGPIVRTTPSVALRLVEAEADWESLDAMGQADRDEQALREGRAPYPASVARGLTALKRACAPPVRLFIAEIEGRDCGHVAAWGGREGIGLVEWVYVVPEARRRGIASALVAHAVEDARCHGAELVLIAPLEGSYDVPRRCYAALGFRPWFRTTRYLRA
jgi:GNAT superfamily N-acetyltransferase